MAPGTFNRFSELPKEIQIQIWQDAASPLGSYTMLGDVFLTRMRDERFGHHESYSPGFFSWISTSHFLISDRSVSDDGETTTARAVLMATCRLSRQVVLELWRSDVRKIEVGGAFAWIREAVKEEILGLLGGLIEAL